MKRDTAPITTSSAGGTTGDFWRGVGAALIATLPSFIWIGRDGHVWPWDQAWYGEVTADLYATLIFHPFGWPDAMRRAMGAKPPLLSWLGQIFLPVGMAIHNVDFALLLLPVLSQVATLVIVKQAAQRMAGGNFWAGLFALLLVAAAPLFVGMSHQFLVESLQTTIVAGSFLLALTANKAPIFRALSLLVLLVFAGFAVKTTTLLYCGLPWLITFSELVRRWRNRGGSREISKIDVVLILAAAVLAVSTCAWYATNFQSVIEHARIATLGDSAELYGRKLSFFPKLAFWATSANQAIFILPGIFAPLVATALLAHVYLGRKRISQATNKSDAALPALVSFAALAHVILVIVVLSTQVNEETRFLEPSLPPFALAVAWSVGRLNTRRLFTILCIPLALALVIVQLQAAGKVRSVATSPWLLPPVPDTQQRDVVDRLIAETCPKTLAGRYVVVGVEWPSMNANSMAYHAAKTQLSTGYRCYYTGLGYIETDAQRAIDRIVALRATFVILPAPAILPKQADVFNRVDHAVEETIMRSKQYSWSGHEIGGYRVYRRKE